MAAGGRPRGSRNQWGFWAEEGGHSGVRVVVRVRAKGRARCLISS